MPSLGEALQCWPDNETENEDGSVTEYYNNITKDKYEKFSAYLKEQGQLAGKFVQSLAGATDEVLSAIPL